MPKIKRPRREHTEDWHQIKQYTLWPEQEVYELLRPVLLFGDTPAERAKETESSERTLRYKADQFDQRGMLSLFPKVPDPPDETARSLPPPMRQAIVDLHAEHPALRLREIATICDVRFGRKPSHHTVKQILATGPKPSITARRFPLYGQIADPFERRRALIVLHAEGWTVTSIAAYMQTTRTRVYETLQRWVQEGFAGLDDKSHAPHTPNRKMTLEVMQEIRKLAREPRTGRVSDERGAGADGLCALPSQLWPRDDPRSSPVWFGLLEERRAASETGDAL